jgi:hypothetical protein
MAKSNYKALPVLIAALTVCENFSANSAALIAEQPQWDDPYIGNFKKLVEKYLSDYFGISTKQELKQATSLVTSIQSQAKEELTMIRTQIVRNFKDNPSRKNALLGLLGYTAHWQKASNKNQTELIGMLYSFVNNLTPALRTELEGKNVNAARLTKVVTIKQTLSDANVTQETLKGTSKLLTAEAVEALNNIYDQAINICEIGKRLFRNDPARRQLFVFSKLLKAQDSSSTVTPEPKTAKGAAK